MSTMMKENKVAMVRVGSNNSQAEEAMAYCPRCKALQTVWLNGNMLMPTLKFTQIDEEIYHNCGSTQPCRLYYSS